MTKLALVVATWYAGIYVGGPLYCGGTYAESTAPWVAVDVSAYQDGRVTCGDWLRVTDGDTVLLARAMDAGYLERHYVEDYGPSIRIGVDIPRHLWPWGEAMSRVVTVENVTRELERRIAQ